MTGLRVIVCGGRDFADGEALAAYLASIPIAVLIEGGAEGADRLARQYGERRGIPVLTFPGRVGQARPRRRSDPQCSHARPGTSGGRPGDARHHASVVMTSLL